MEYHARFDKLCGALEGGGAFLVVADAKGRVNVMTIGWAQAGVTWGTPLLTVMVRPSRYTHSFLTKASHFSVCVPPAGEMKKELAFCGSRSGRDYDKVRACAMTLKDGTVKGVKYLEGSELVYECEISGRAELRSDGLPAAVLGKYYPSGDLHTLFFGKIVKAENLKK
jgi:flavin reductase (DIM6/NTAB) family NADH-FMN oxidoreductase RutF